MAKKKHLKALVMGAVAMTLSCSMLVGTTFAWFTDSVTSNNNVIKSGNLDIALEYWDGDSWEDVSGKSDILTNELWEPGATEVAYFRIANEGSLALKYQFGVNIVSETVGKNVAGQDLRLSDYIYYNMNVIETETSGAPKTYANRDAAMAVADQENNISDGYNETGSLMAEAERYLAMVVHMPDDVGNEANHDGVNVPEINLGISVFATQVENEEDSFGDGYDNGAPIMEAPQKAPTNGNDFTVKGSLESKVSVTVPYGVYSEFAPTVEEVYVAASAPIVDETNKTVKFETLELVDQDGNEVELADSTDKVTVTLSVDGAFADGEVVEIYHDSEFVTYATVASGKISYQVSHFCEVMVKVAEEVKLEVVDNTLTINTVKEFVKFAESVNGGNSYAGKTVVLGADMDLAGVTWTPIGTSSNIFKGTFDGNGKVIRNLEVLMNGKSNVGLFGVTHDGEIKNVTVENAKVAGRLCVGVVAGTPYTSKYTNITVKGLVEVDGMAYVGAVGGKDAYANWTNVTVNVADGSYVNANSVENDKAYRTYVGGVVGFNGEGGHVFKNITSNINVYGSTIDVGGAFGIAHYGNQFENVTVTGNVEIYNASEAADAQEIGGIAGVWHNGGANVVFTKCAFSGKLSANVEVDLTANTITGKAYGTTGNGLLVIDGVEYVGSAAALQTKLNSEEDVVVTFGGDVVGDVTVTQKPDVKVTIDGNGYNFSGVLTVDGKSARYETAALTIENVNFKAEKALSADAFVRLGHVNAARYTNNVTVENCTFDSNGYKYKEGAKESAYVAVKSYTGGDWNLTLKDLTVNEDMHSLAQLKNVEKNLVVTNCTVNSKNGLNVNNGTNLTMSGCTFNVKGYAVRFGESANTTDETFVISDSTLTSACAESGDAVVEIRAGAANANITFTDTTLTGKVLFKGMTAETNVVIDGVTAVYDGDSLKAALAAKKDVIFVNDITMSATESNAYGSTGINVKYGQTIDGNNFTLKVSAGGTWGSAISTTGGLIKNLTVAQGFRGIFVNHNSDYSEMVVLENVTIQGPTYTISCDQGMSQGLVAKNCTINGWTSYAATIGSVKFEGCTFGKGAGYAFARPYAATEFVNCTFSAGYAIDARDAITFEGCVFNGAAVTAENLATLVTSNTANASVK